MRGEDLNLVIGFLCTGATRWIAIGILALLGLGAPARSQQTSSSSNRAPATVTFMLDFPHSNPEHYSISIDQSGRARYECSAQVAQDSEPQSYQTEFDLSAGSREKIFAWAKQAQFFSRDVDSKNGKLAFTGTKVLSYRDGQHAYTARYNYSTLAPVKELTVFFQDLAATLEFGHRLAYDHRYEKLALDSELKQMESQAKNGELKEIQSVAPVLQEIVADPSVLNGVRARAKELLESATGASAAAPH
jgi:hypothetical protein